MFSHKILIRCRMMYVERKREMRRTWNILIYRETWVQIWDVRGEKGRVGERQWLGTRTVLDKKAGADQSGKLVSLNNSALN